MLGIALFLISEVLARRESSRLSTLRRP
jgi:hypothetical protein